MYCEYPVEDSHSIVSIDENGERVILPFFLKGVSDLTFKCFSTFSRGV